MLRPLAMLLLLATGLIAGVPASAAPYQRISPIPGVSFEVPRNLLVRSENSRITIDAYVAARDDLAADALESELPFAGQVRDDTNRPLILISLRTYPEETTTQAWVENLNEAEILLLDLAMREEMLSADNPFEVVSWLGTERRRIGGTSMLVTSYERTSLRGPGRFRVQLARVLDGARSHTLIVSHLVSPHGIRAPIADRVLRSHRMR